MRNKHLTALLTLTLLAGSMLACGTPKAPPPPGGEAAALAVESPSARSVDHKKAAEQRVLPSMTAALQEYVRAQAWYAEVTEIEFKMLETVRETEKTAIKYGAEVVFMDTMRLTAEQAWVQDGLEDVEAQSVVGLMRAYQASLNDRYIPNIGTQMVSTIRGNYFHTMALPETGQVTLMVASDSEKLAPGAFALAIETLPKIEGLVGAFPYPFLFIWVTELPDGIAGLSRNEFILLSPLAVDRDTMAHEMTHATLYGRFPTWFEEGFAYFMGAYVDGGLKAKETDSLAVLAATKRPRKLDLTAKFDHSDRGYFSTISQGFLFMKGLSDIEGVEGLGGVVRALRSKTYNNDNELLRAIVTNSPPELQQRVQQYLCDSVIGLRSGCQ